jgi:hypothetical protein
MRKRIGWILVAFALAPSPVAGQEASTMKICLTFDGKAVDATLLDNATAPDLFSLPIALTLEDYNSTEEAVDRSPETRANHPPSPPSSMQGSNSDSSSRTP